jgi:hypothetical protein
MTRRDLIEYLAEQIWNAQRTDENIDLLEASAIPEVYFEKLAKRDVRMWRQATNDEYAECMLLAEACLERSSNERAA